MSKKLDHIGVIVTELEQSTADLANDVSARPSLIASQLKYTPWVHVDDEIVGDRRAGSWQVGPALDADLELRVRDL